MENNTCFTTNFTHTDPLLETGERGTEESSVVLCPRVNPYTLR